MSKAANFACVVGIIFLLFCIYGITKIDEPKTAKTESTEYTTPTIAAASSELASSESVSSVTAETSKYLNASSGETSYASAVGENMENAIADYAKSDHSKEKSAADAGVPDEYAEDFKTAKVYARIMHLSKKQILGQLTTSDGVPSDVAQTIIDNLDVDWNDIALSCAKSYMNIEPYSELGLRGQMLNGSEFTESETDYAMSNINADWNANALRCAKNYQSLDMDKDAIKTQLTSIEQYTDEQAQYAYDNL